MPERYRFPMVLCLMQGLRIGEAIYLRRRHLTQTPEGDWIMHVVGHVQRLTIDGLSTLVEQEPKTEAGRREVPIFDTYVPLLKRHMHDFVRPGRDAFVCATAEGNRGAEAKGMARLHCGDQAGRHVLSPHTASALCSLAAE